MHDEAGRYIQQWRDLALLAGLLAALGGVVGVYGMARAWSTVGAVVRLSGGRALVYVSWADMMLLACLTAAALVEVAISIGLVVLAGRYPDDLAAVLAVLDGAVTIVYVGYVVQVALVNLVAPIYLAIRMLARLEEVRRDDS